MTPCQDGYEAHMEGNAGPPGGRERYERGLEDYHDPSARVGGAPPARSALTLRLWLAGFGFLISLLIIMLARFEDLVWLVALGTVLAVVAAVDFVWVLHRKRRGEPG